MDCVEARAEGEVGIEEVVEGCGGSATDTPTRTTRRPLRCFGHGFPGSARINGSTTHFTAVVATCAVRVVAVVVGGGGGARTVVGGCGRVIVIEFEAEREPGVWVIVINEV